MGYTRLITIILVAAAALAIGAVTTAAHGQEVLPAGLDGCGVAEVLLVGRVGLLVGRVGARAVRLRDFVGLLRRQAMDEYKASQQAAHKRTAAIDEQW